MIDDNIVLQPEEEVVKPDDDTDDDRRFQALESKISELKSLILSNESVAIYEIKKEDEPNGLGRIRTGDLRRVKATS